MLKGIPEALERGSNPVEIAGFGRESTHKGYLSWLLDTQHWLDARKFLINLLKISNKDSACKLIDEFPMRFWCGYEIKIGSGRVDLCIHDYEDNQILPIELKTDTVVGSEQLEKLAFRDRNIGLVFLLGSSAVQDDNASEEERYGYELVPLDKVLNVLDEFEHGLPNPGKDWLEALRNESSRLNDCFELSESEQNTVSWNCQNDYFWDFGYRNKKHLYFALLSSVKRSNAGIKCSLYDGGRNAVLNFPGRTEVANGNAECYWEFNDEDLCLKVAVQSDNNRTSVKDWIIEIQNSITDCWVEFQKSEQSNLENFVELKRPRSPNMKWNLISVRRWIFNFDEAQNVAHRSQCLINYFNEKLNLRMQ